MTTAERLQEVSQHPRLLFHTFVFRLFFTLFSQIHCRIMNTNERVRPALVCYNNTYFLGEEKRTFLVIALYIFFTSYSCFCKDTLSNVDVKEKSKKSIIIHKAASILKLKHIWFLFFNDKNKNYYWHYLHQSSIFLPLNF